VDFAYAWFNQLSVDWQSNYVSDVSDVRRGPTVNAKCFAEPFLRGPVEVASRSPDHRAGLFGTAFDARKADRSRSQTAGSRRVDAHTRSGRSAPEVAWPQTAIGGRGSPGHLTALDSGPR
jgi:hypothetical protein